MAHLGTSEDHLSVVHPYHGVDRLASDHHVPASSVDHPSCGPSSDRHDLRGLGLDPRIRHVHDRQIHRDHGIHLWGVLTYPFY